MKNSYLIALVVIILLLGFLYQNQITGQFAVVPVPFESSLDTCLSQTRTGLNVLPNMEICCDTIKSFFQCEEIEVAEIPYGQYFATVNRQCYNNINGELKVFYTSNLEAFCINEGYLDEGYLN